MFEYDMGRKAKFTQGGGGPALGRLSLKAAIMLSGKDGPFTTADILARFPDHCRKNLSATLSDMVEAKTAYRLGLGRYRLAGVV